MKVSLPGGSLEAHLPARPGAPVSSGVKVQCQPLPRTQRSVPQGRGQRELSQNDGTLTAH